MLGKDVLYFYYQNNCAACAQAEPVLADFEKLHRGEVMVVRLNIGIKDWEIDGWSPKYTPGYQLVRSRATVNTHEGQLSLSQLERFIGTGQHRAAPAKKQAVPVVKSDDKKEA